VAAAGRATFESLVPAALDERSWLLHVPGLWSWSDWPELTGLGRGWFLVQYRTGDELFSSAGMQEAHRRLEALHAESGRYRGSFSDGGHVFDEAMQFEAWDHLTS
jgi:hypothetical protein